MFQDDTTTRGLFLHFNAALFWEKNFNRQCEPATAGQRWLGIGENRKIVTWLRLYVCHVIIIIFDYLHYHPHITRKTLSSYPRLIHPFCVRWDLPFVIFHLFSIFHHLMVLKQLKFENERKATSSTLSHTNLVHLWRQLTIVHYFSLHFFLVFSICRTSWFFCIFYVEYFFTKKLKDDLCGLALIFVYFVFLSQVLYLASGKPSPETFYFSSGLWQDKRILTSIQLP